MRIENVPGEYKQDSSEGQQSGGGSVILYSEGDATGEFTTNEGHHFTVYDWSLGEGTFGVRVVDDHERRQWIGATYVEYAEDGKVSYFEFFHGKVGFTRAEPRRIRLAPGTTVEGRVTLTFH